MSRLINVARGSGATRTSLIFLHGLGGDPRSTWQSGADARSFWPRWLTEDIEGLSVYVVGYEAPISRWRGTAMHLTDCATNVLAWLLAEAHLRQGKIILIGHSLGGLVIKQLIRTAESEARHRADVADLLARIEKIAFLATPHTGSGLASWGDRLRILVRPSAATTCLVRNDPNLRDLNLWYRDWADAQNIFHLTLTEAEPIRILGMIVKPDSSDPGLTRSRPVPISANHWTICKPVNRKCETYVQVRTFIERQVERPKSPVEKKLDALPDAVVARLIAKLDERGEAAAAERAGVHRQAIVQLAQRIKADVSDFDQALRELERAVEIAIEVAEEGRRGSNAGDFVDAVLARIAAKSADGRHDDAAAEADAAFAQWELEEGERRIAALQGGLKLLHAGLRQDILRRNPMSAARRIDRMVALEHSENRAVHFAALRGEHDELYKLGRDQGLNFYLAISIEIARLCHAAASGADEAGAALSDLGNALLALGEREVRTTRLEEAVVAYREALNELTCERVPLEWAGVQNNLGNALVRLGERGLGTVCFKEAVAAFRDALKERTRKRVPLDWAATQVNMGLALSQLGEREPSTEPLEAAVTAYREALKEQTQEQAPRERAMTQNNLGIVLFHLGERELGTQRLEDAVAAFREALKECTRNRGPLVWAMTQNNLGLALSSLGERKPGTAHFRAAIAAYCEALEELGRERVPLQWAGIQNNLGGAFLRLGKREIRTACLKGAVAAFREALKEYTRECTPREWAGTQNNLGGALLSLGLRRSGTAKLEEAATAYGEALKEFVREQVPIQWATSVGEQGVTLGCLAARRGDLRIAEQALAQITAAFETCRDAHDAHAADQYEALVCDAQRLVEALRKGDAPGFEGVKVATIKERYVCYWVFSPAGPFVRS